MIDVELSTYNVAMEACQERRLQNEKWGDQSDKGVDKWYAILGEEFGEVSKDVCELLHGNEDSRVFLRKELVQVAAVALAFIEYGDKNKWWK